MNRLFVFALTIALAGAATSLFTRSGDHGLSSVAAQQNSAAFRDGMYLGKLDAQSARKPHLTASRWTIASDRSAFLAGYESVYGKVGNAYATTDSSAELIGFHDGVSDGLQHRQASRQFQLDKTENFRRADRGLDDKAGNSEKYRQSYRQAYLNGYQQAFYSGQNLSLGELSQQASF